MNTTFSTSAEAQYWIDNQVNSLKDPYTHALITVRGRAQIGFRPPQQLTLTISNIAHPISAESFKVVRATHKSSPVISECELDLHEALKLLLPIPDVLEFLRGVAWRHRLRAQEQKVSKWTVS